MNCTMNVVAEPGPPPVSTNTSSNTCTARISPSTSTTTRLGMSSGSVMRVNRRQGEAASISAASYRSAGIACRPASRMSV
jgi:hypothetical protein